MKKVLVCVGTRPNLIKITQLKKAFSAYPELDYKLMYTGQHYDYLMSQIFFNELHLGNPDFRLTLPEGSPVKRISDIINEFDQFLNSNRPDMVVVPGDVDSSFACAFAASRRNISVAHIESGLRSFDRSMPEEINRILIDDLSDLLFVSEPSGIHNLKAEGKADQKVKFVGNTMIDTLIAFMSSIDKSDIHEKLKLGNRKYLLLTLHRPSNVDLEKSLRKGVELINSLSRILPVVFPVHPRTLKNLEKYNLKKQITSGEIIITEPLGYFDFMNLVKNSSCVITDSGGVQEETTFLNVPCLTLRDNTERPVTIEQGTNKLMKPEDNIAGMVEKYILKEKKIGSVPELWDGNTSGRIAKEISSWFQSL